MRLIIDRIEENIAVCEDPSGNRREFRVDELPPGAGEGDVLDYTGGVFARNQKATLERRKYIQKLMDDVFE